MVKNLPSVLKISYTGCPSLSNNFAATQLLKCVPELKIAKI